MKKVFGFGVNDSDSQIHETKIIEGRKVNIWTCPFYMVWANMLKRCYSADFHKKQPTYTGCSVSLEWQEFSSFRVWMSGQKWQGMAIDKDILFPGNKLYSPETCVFITRALNQFTVDRCHRRGEWPLGVSWSKGKLKLRATCCNPFTLKTEHLGYFVSPDSAHEAWRNRKHQLACLYADMQADQRIAAALRSRYAQKKELA